jgi:tetratricopeptide (TPR) repeat protein
MMKQTKFPYTFLAFVLVVAIAILSWLTWPQALLPSAPLPPTVQPGQEGFAGHLELGLLYQGVNRLELAAAEFEQAALATQPEIASAARANLQHVLEAQNSLQYRTGAAIPAALNWLLGAILVLLFLLIILLWIAWQYERSIQRAPYRLMDFEDLTPDAAGKGLHRLVLENLYLARQVHRDARTALYSPADPFDLPLQPPETISNSEMWQAVESVQVGGLEIPLGKLLPAVESWANRRARRITGCVSSAGSSLILNARLLHGDQVMQSWEIICPQAGGTPAAAQILARQFAFHLLVYLAHEDNAKMDQRLPARSPRAMMRLTDGLLMISRSRENGPNRVDLEQAVDALEEVIELDPECKTAYCALGAAYTQLGRFSEAQDVLLRVMDGALASPKVGKEQLFAQVVHYRLGMAYYYTYQDKGFLKAKEYFDTVQTGLEAENPPSDDEGFLLALVYCGMACLGAEWIERPPRFR